MTLVGLAAKKLSIKKRNVKLAAAFPNGVRCQKCLEYGHWSYQCKGKRKFVHRTSRTKQLNKNIAEIINTNPNSNNDVNASKSVDAIATSSGFGNKQNKMKHSKRSHTSSSSSSDSSSSSSDSSSSDTSEDSSDNSTSSCTSDSESSSDSDTSGSSTDSSGSDNEATSPKKKKLRKNSNSSSSSSADVDSDNIII